MTVRQTIKALHLLIAQPKSMSDVCNDASRTPFCLLGRYALQAAACLCRGITANVVLLIYYSAPLTTVKEVLVSRSSSSLYWPLCMMNVLNGLLWVGYGRVSNAILWNACACFS